MHHLSPTHSSSAARHPRLLRTVLFAVLATAALLGAACADDEASPDTGDHGEQHQDEPTAAPEDDEAAAPAGPAPLEGEAMPEEACSHFSTLSAAMTGDPSIAEPALAWFVQSLPLELTDSGTTVVDGLASAFEGDPSAMGDPSFVSAFDEIGSAMWAGCEAASRLDVTGVDYEFEGLPRQIPAGMSALRFTNDSANGEPHELIVVQRPPGDETSIEEIEAMTADEVLTDFPMTGVVFVDAAGSSSASFMDLPTGRYIAICTIPVGGGETGDPHHAQGMVAEFEAV